MLFFSLKLSKCYKAYQLVECRVDDILVSARNDQYIVSGKNDKDHLNNLNDVLTRLKQAGLRLKMEKCKFMKPSVKYLGYRVDMHGLHVIEKKVEAIKNAPAPENQQQLRSFLGMVNYYAKFVSNYSTVVRQLNELLRHNVKWRWTKKENNAFCTLKNNSKRSACVNQFSQRLAPKVGHRRKQLWNRCRNIAHNAK